MSKSESLLKTIQLLRMLPAPVTAKVLAEELEVNQRTVYRYIDSLRVSGAQIDGEAGYGYTLMEDPSLPPMLFDSDEIEALVLGLREVEEIGDPVLARAAKNVRAKVNASLPQRLRNELEHAVLTVKRFQSRAEPKIDVSLLRSITRTEKEARIEYIDAKGNPTNRTIYPLSIVYMDSSLMLISYCQLRKDYRAFRVDRISQVKETGNSFKPRRVSMLREALKKMSSSNGETSRSTNS